MPEYKIPISNAFGEPAVITFKDKKSYNVARNEASSYYAVLQTWKVKGSKKEKEKIYIYFHPKAAIGTTRSLGAIVAPANYRVDVSAEFVKHLKELRKTNKLRTAKGQKRVYTKTHKFA